jgi:hypothetical protein
MTDINAPLTLDEAAEICLRGKVKAATLRADSQTCRDARNRITISTAAAAAIRKSQGLPAEPEPLNPRGDMMREDYVAYLQMTLIDRKHRNLPTADVMKAFRKLGITHDPLYASATMRGLVYFIGCKDFVKIGFTTDLTRRLNDLQNCVPFKLKVHAKINGCSIADEKALHRRFEKHRTEFGEWFRYAIEIQDYVYDLKMKR